MKKVVLFKSVSEEYEKVFTDNNFEVIFIEPLQFTFINTEELNNKLTQNYDGLILTSPRAIEAVANLWNPSKFVLWNTKKVYTVGEASRQNVALRLGLEALGSTSGNAENLAKIIADNNSKCSKFLFPCGNKKSETLPNLLQSAEIDVDAVTVYETKENENLQKQLMKVTNLEKELLCVVFFSPSGCEYVYRTLQTLYNRLSDVPHFAIGNTTAHKIENFGVEIAGVAAKPSASSMVETIQKYFAS
ncbi:unnamed protein product [Diatraea saccharalis]|uniref:Uroporphyrinogen-III synthase n=1 Tax=Diatraea saccharalis TaxID=40085 RepID=A0A9N9WHL7_9NEOP|nr:unnamed protein product [Diatraea saccharalis]